MPIRNNKRFFIKKPRNFDIWAEGYACTGQSNCATLLGTIAGVDFADACENFFRSNPSMARDFDPSRLTYWGCRLFDNERAARKSFG